MIIPCIVQQWESLNQDSELEDLIKATAKEQPIIRDLHDLPGASSSREDQLHVPPEEPGIKPLEALASSLDPVQGSLGLMTHPSVIGSTAAQSRVEFACTVPHDGSAELKQIGVLDQPSDESEPEVSDVDGLCVVDVSHNTMDRDSDLHDVLEDREHAENVKVRSENV